MSAYIVSYETLARIAETLAYKMTFPNNGNAVFLNVEPIKRVLKDCYFAWNKEYMADEIYKRLHAMNAAAVAERYKEEPEATPDTMPTVRRYSDSELVELIKAIDCYLYQCSEGDVPENELYKALYDFNVSCYRYKVQSTNEYQRAPWG